MNLTIESIKKGLRTKIVDTDSIHLDLWSIVHFSVGYALYFYFKLKPWQAFIILFGFELIEPVFMPFFKSEPVKDTVWDVIVGMVGYYIARGGM